MKNEIGEEKAQRKKHENERVHKKLTQSEFQKNFLKKINHKYILKTKKERKTIDNNAIIPEPTLLQKMLQQC
jgi:uncharacterized protein YggL (DUF469 family)